jgi:hypothetical protein
MNAISGIVRMKKRGKENLYSRWLIQTQCSSVIIEYNDRCRLQFDIHIHALSKVNNNLFNFFLFCFAFYK